MEHEIEDKISEVNCIDSQKSVATTNAYSCDFTDSDSDKYNRSSSKGTYVIDHEDSDDSESTANKYAHSTIRSPFGIVSQTQNLEFKRTDTNNESTQLPTSRIYQNSFVPYETFTQTSKTILELAQNERDCKTLETQTSLISIIENRTVQYKVVDASSIRTMFHVEQNYNTANFHDSVPYDVQMNSLRDNSSKVIETELNSEKSKDNTSESSYCEDVIKIIDDFDEIKEDCENYDSRADSPSVFEISFQTDSDIEEDSLMSDRNKRYLDNKDSISEVSKTSNLFERDITELYEKNSEDMKVYSNNELRRMSVLTPLTEESTTKKDNLIDITPNIMNMKSSVEETDTGVLFINKAGVKIKVFNEEKSFKLPSIQSNNSLSNSPHMNLIVSNNYVQSKPFNTSDTLPPLNEEFKDGDFNKWELNCKKLAAEESAHINEKQYIQKEPIQLPPIQLENYIRGNGGNIPESFNSSKARREDTISTKSNKESISIRRKIKELKMYTRSPVKSPTNSELFRATQQNRSRSISPRSDFSNDIGLCDAAERGCDALCGELLRRLRSTTWIDVSNALEELPKVMEKFWVAISEDRLADLIRQVSQHVESPRTRVAKNACTSLAHILKNTKYVKKPDFYEAMMVLLIKTSSFSRPVRRAANMALDEVVTAVDYTHAVTAVCVHGACHKSPLVRCASARLLVVCTALAGCGRNLLRSRPPSAAAARRHALCSLAAFLDDRNVDTRKYAERLYSMLRPLAKFEAYYLTDVDVETATRQMKKHDRLLLCAPRVESR